MRWIAWLSLALVAAGWLACHGLDPTGGLSDDRQRAVGAEPGTPARSFEAPWRRTADGWERASWCRTSRRPHHPALHPLVVALLEVLLSLLALVAFAEPRPE